MPKLTLKRKTTSLQTKPSTKLFPYSAMMISSKKASNYDKEVKSSSKKAKSRTPKKTLKTANKSSKTSKAKAKSEKSQPTKITTFPTFPSPVFKNPEMTSKNNSINNLPKSNKWKPKSLN